MDILMTVLKIIGAGVGIIIFLAVIGWLVEKLDVATGKLKEITDSNYPNYEVSIFRMNGDLMLKEVMGYSDTMDIRNNLKPHYYCEIIEIIEISD